MHKNALALKEARESLYWLRLAKRTGIVDAERLGPLSKETDELVAIITTIIVRAKKKAE